MKEFGRQNIFELTAEDLQPIESESDVIEDAERRILSQDEAAMLFQRHGLVEGSHGTFSDREKTIYLYIKPKFQAADQRDLEEKLAILRWLTQQGVLYPETRWGAFRDGNTIQIFAITRALQHIDPREHISDKEGPFYNRKKIEQILGENATSTDRDNLLLMSPESHITRWFRRIDPAYNPAQGPKKEYAHLLNWAEASHTDNWGFDSQGNTFYPIDVEVIDLPTNVALKNPIHVL